MRNICWCISEGSTIDKGVKGFKSSGIYPYNPDVFGDEDYAPATVIEQPFEVVHGHASCVDAHVSAETPPKKRKTKSTHKNQTAAVCQSTECQTPHRDIHTSGDTHVSVLDISPLPHAKSSGVSKRKAESSAVITSFPYKVWLESKSKPERRGEVTGESCRHEPRTLGNKKGKQKKTEMMKSDRNGQITARSNT